jgi:hypothetical protein
MAVVINGDTGISPVTASGTSASVDGMTVGRGGGAVSTNTAVGASALAVNTTGDSNVALGTQALAANTTGYANSATGQLALLTNTTGNLNTATGSSALRLNTTGSNNTALGQSALYSNTTASNNTAVGYQAGYNNTVGQFNVLLGYQAGYRSAGTGSIGDASVLIGYQAGYANQGNNNVGIGNGALSGNTTGTFNVGLGVGAGNAITTGAKNTIIGAYTGNQGGLDIRTASNRIVLSDGDGNPRVFSNGIGNICIGGTTGGNSFFGTEQLNVTQSASDWTFYGYNAYVGTYYGVRMNTSSTQNNTSSLLYDGLDGGTLRFRVYANGGIANYSANNSNLSDQREKKDIEFATNYLDKICAIPVKTFLYNDQTDEDLNLGVIAQDVQAVAPELVAETDWSENGDGSKMRLSIYQTDLQYALMKSIQELKTIVDAQAAEIAELKAK